MPTTRSSILIIFAAIGFVALSLTPRGLALCIGGGHDVTDLIAGWCDTHGGHVHGLPAPHHACADHDHAHHQETTECGDHSHDNHAQPCADIPLGLEECRPGDKSLIATPMMPAAAIMPIASMDSAWVSSVAPASSLRYHFSGSGPPRELRCSLRAVVLLI